MKGSICWMTGNFRRQYYEVYNALGNRKKRHRHVSLTVMHAPYENMVHSNNRLKNIDNVDQNKSDQENAEN
jgi:hypothetical protein